MEYLSAILSLWSILHFICGAFGGAIEQPEINSANNALVYLSRYGYIDHSATNSEMGGLVAQEAVTDAIKEFQAFAGLNQTGTLDERTIEMMNTPRCGVVDKVGYGSNARRKKRYALQGSRWKTTDLTYKVTKYPKELTISEVDRDIDRAFQVWADITELTFTPVRTGKIQIEIRFEKGEHGDGDAFDGAGGTLAHAYFPIYGGDAHFDESETWTVDSYKGTNLFQVAAHEFGHSLGLSHSDVQSALMAPFYRGYQRSFSLDDDDVSAIQNLYGNKNTKDKKPSVPKKYNPAKPTAPSKPSTPEADQELCRDSSIDAIVTTTDKKTYVFKDKNVWLLQEENGIEKGYPKPISKEFDGLPPHIDAAFTWPANGKTYIFKNNEYWRYTGTVMDDGYPKQISDGFSGIPSNVNAAFVWSGNGKIYFFKGKDYYKFDPDQRPPVSYKYPREITMWEGLPNYIDDAFQYSNGFTYFFKNGKYWRFNDRNFKVDSADPAFPRSVGPWWFGCPDKGSQETLPDNTNPVSPRKTDNDVSTDDAFNTDYSYDDDQPKLGSSLSQDYYDNGASQQVTSRPLYLSWLVIPLLLSIICL